MADQVIKIQMTGADDMSAAFKIVAANAENLTAKTEAARLGLWGLGYAAESAAQSLGVPGAISNQLGQSVENLAGKLGIGAVALGTVGMAATAGITIWNFYSEAQRKSREETIRSGSEARSWIETTYKDEVQTKALTAAIYAQTEAKRDQSRFDLSAKIRQNAQDLIDMEEKINKVTAEYREITKGLGDDAPTDSFTAIAMGRKQAELAQLQRELTSLKTDIKVDEERLKQSSNPSPKTKPPKSKDGEVTVTEQAQAGLLAYTGQVTDAQQAQFQLMMQTNGMTESLIRSGTGWDILASKTNGVSQIIADNEALIARASQMRGNISLAVNKSMEEQLLRLVETHKFSAGAIAQAMAQAAKMELITMAAQASIKALYYSAAALVAAATYDEVSAALFWAAAGDYAMIAGATLAGAAAINAVSSPGAKPVSAGGITSNPVYTSGGSSGGSTGNSGSGGNITININGQKVGEYRQLAGGVLKAIYENNGSVDGYSLGVELHA